MEDKENKMKKQNKTNWYDGAITCYIEREKR